MTDQPDLHAALAGAEGELISRLTNPKKRAEMADGVIIRAIEVLNRRLPPRPATLLLKDYARSCARIRT